MKKYFNILFFGCIALGLVSVTTCYADQSKPVTLKEGVDIYTMDNGIVSVIISKLTGDIVSFRYNGTQMFATSLTPDGEPDLEKDPPGANPNGLNRGMTDHQYGYWSHDAMGVKGSGQAIPSVTIDPKNNGGKIAEISVKGISNGRKMGTGPGAKPDGDLTVDIEIRYTLEQGVPGVYTYSIFEHKPEYPLAQFAEARFCAKLAAFFDWMSVDENVDFHYPKGYNAGDKYVYTASQWANRAFGWSSTTQNVGLFFINPSMEYMSGGPTKIEFLGHRDTNKEAAPCVLNYWRSSHYGGAEANMAAGEAWDKVVGPFLIYANSGEGHDAIYADAKVRANVENQKWPYSWVKGVNYPLAQDRSTVKGKFTLNDGDKKFEFQNFMVGLAAPEYASPRQEGQPTAITNWQRDAKFYQFWTKGNKDGSFEISKVRPGSYTLYAFTDGVLGEFNKADIVVSKGKSIDLGKLIWTPMRKGRQVWDIGIPNRNPTEFFKADERTDPNIPLKYATLFPDDITYVIGKSDYKKDWFFQHVPHNEDPNAKSEPFFGVRTSGRATPYTIIFDLPTTPKGKAILRVAICGTGAKYIDVAVNENNVGKLENLLGDGVITRHGIQGLWYERELEFDCSAMKQGTNKLVMTIPEGSVNNGVMYDYIRFEIAD